MASLILLAPASGVSPPTSSGRKLTTIDLVGGIYCHICNLVFGNKKEFDSHYLGHNTGTEVITYTCVACYMSNTSYPRFRGHCYTTHVIKDRFKCDHCNKNFSKISALKEHIDAIHNIRCNKPNCDKRFRSKKELHVHQILHKEDAKPPYQCQTCSQEIENLNSCEDHIDKHCIFTYPCPICKENLTKDNNNATQHLSTHFGDIDVLNGDFNEEEMPEDSSINIVGGIFCCHCKKLFKNRIEIDQHFVEEHPDHTALYSCVICGKQYEKYSLFGNHCYFHYTKNRFVCETCHKAFSRLSLLVSHAEVHKVESNESMYKNSEEMKCQLCGLHLKGLIAAQRHLSVHRRSQFSCPVCARRYGEKYLLMKHIPQHFEAVLHMCKVCLKVFAAKNRLIEHAKTHSPAAKSYECKYCGKGFFKPYQLSQHVNVHTGARPYTCPECPKTFASQPNCHKHMRRMHNFDKKRIKINGLLNNDSDSPIKNENDSDFEAEETIVQEVKKTNYSYGVVVEPEPVPVAVDSQVEEREAVKYEAELKSLNTNGDSIAELTPILPEDIDKFLSEMLNPDPPALIPREYGPDFGPEEAPLPHVAPQLVGPPVPLSHSWEPPIFTKVCTGFYDALDDVSLSFIDTDIF